jgi:hypothetical protein
MRRKEEYLRAYIEVVVAYFSRWIRLENLKETAKSSFGTASIPG